MLPMIFAQISIFQYPLGILLFIMSLFLILLILVQRGRGGGLTGALGGMGGQSAFGSKAGDVFTRVTVVVAAVWILLCLLIISLFTQSGFGNTGPVRKPAKGAQLVQPGNQDESSKGAPGGTGKKGTAAPSGKGASGSKKETSSDD